MCHSNHYCLIPLWLTESAFGCVDLATKDKQPELQLLWLRLQIQLSGQIQALAL
jgi:hypothetical protein